MSENEVVEALCEMIDEERAAVVEFLYTHGCPEIAKAVLRGDHHRSGENE